MTKKIASISLALLVSLAAFTGCGSPTPTPAPTAAATSAPTPSPSPTATQTPEPTPEPTPAGVYSGDVYEYFERVGFAGGGESDGVVAKWASPIRIQAQGSPTAGDQKALTALIQGLGGIAGLPEISFVTAGGNVLMCFLPKSEAASAVEGYDGVEDSYFTAMWGDSPRALLFISNELTAQASRDAALASSLYRALGLKQDADRQYPDSVLNPDAGAGQPSMRDTLMLKLLYCAKLTPGMGKDAAMAALPALNPDAVDTVLSAAQKLEYFNEVGFFWPDSARDGIVSKWKEPITLELKGEPTAKLREALDACVARLNRIAGFPGITQVESDGALVVTFAERATILDEFPGMADNEACAWKPTRAKGGVISKCRIGVASGFTDENQSLSQFLRVFIWSLGLNFTSETLPDSILNLQAAAGAWSEADWAMLETLYRADLEPGAKRTAAMALLAGN